jgi:hypothetical protein
VTLPEVVRATSPENSAKFRSTTSTRTSSFDPTPTRTRRHRGPLHASRLSSHRVRTPHSMSTSHTTSASLARPTRRLSLHAGPGKRSPPSTTRTPTPSPATTRTPPMSSTSERTRTSPSPRPTRRSNHYQDLPLAWL